MMEMPSKEYIVIGVILSPILGFYFNPLTFMYRMTELGVISSTTAVLGTLTLLLTFVYCRKRQSSKELKTDDHDFPIDKYFLLMKEIHLQRCLIELEEEHTRLLEKLTTVLEQKKIIQDNEILRLQEEILNGEYELARLEERAKRLDEKKLDIMNNLMMEEGEAEQQLQIEAEIQGMPLLYDTLEMEPLRRQG